MSASGQGQVFRVGASALALFCAAVVFVGVVIHDRRTPDAASARSSRLEKLGGALFADRNLSFNRRQNCVSCHSPDLAFTDPRELGAVAGAVSRGADGRSLGDRNAPPVTYAAFAPAFHIDATGEPVGGLFWDGRAATLEDQAGGPPLNPVEMGMPDKASVVARLKENAAYVSAFRALFGEAVFDDDARAFAAMTAAIAAFERAPAMSPFDSKYDRVRRGEAALTEKETAGRDLFFSRERGNCAACHMSGEGAPAEREVFSNFRYYNLGVPVNRVVRALNGSAPRVIDGGLASGGAVPHEARFDGRFKVPGLRNVAITAPYGHNGAFRDLRTVLLSHQRGSDPRAGERAGMGSGGFGEPEVPATVSADLKAIVRLDDRDIDALIAFLKTLTDRRYERFLKN
ncbi:Di-heme cytochrome c peroxidase [Rhodomicrobium vannielii ATCC 17100]|uniref:Di-heme cytochrome c peroxidase n=1 Tax=Rhodomicrobium vannielii (strain ATCC 17100 / DSM 162 / LMG 4299 / NCIMB 10020 / ATH 3.1.1) TaxID=648757 RepID=E3I401_RHOVT|nr:cytochrome c peroxidase [Rhodomicrobium vannielii]ADP72650.1 Di-heme cytochrome c peroxidase [Rhodomicrobium vannielii ATCC 17100]